jgi:hypothetical protein
MAFDYKTLQEIAAGRPTDASRHCPECGRPWHAPPIGGAPASGRIAWWVWPAVALGIYLLVSFAPRVWVAVHWEVGRGALPPSSLEGPTSREAAARRAQSTPGLLPTATCLTAGTEQDYTSCDPSLAWAGAVIGLVWLVTGLGEVARVGLFQGPRQNRLSDETRRGAASRNLLAGLGIGLWAIVEGAVRACLELQLVLVGFFVSAHLIRGTPWSGGIVAGAVDQSIAVVAAALKDL